MLGSLLGFGMLLLLIVLMTTTHSTAASIAYGMLAIVLLAAGVFAWIRYLRWRNNHATLPERVPVTMDAEGLTMRGVGPIDWANFAPAIDRPPGAASGRGSSAGAVLPLTDNGMQTLHDMPPQLRHRITPFRVLGWRHRYLELPGIQGLNQREVKDLINTAHRKFEPGS